ncbi:GSCOCG00005582001-RA-CDS [Cotesia congregata]|nr:GSCOCG00005582001-RA-CDS [Cotesia congregata]
MTEAATKRDKHFVELQNAIGSAIAVQAAAISMMLESSPREDIDQESFCELLSHAGQLLTDTFYQLSVTRKSFITPLMDKVYKSSLDEAKADEWLYGKKFTEQVKEVKLLEKTSSGLKPAVKKANPPKSSGNGKYPPAKPKQVGTTQWKKPTFRFTRKTNYSQNQSTGRTSSRSSNPATSKK